MTDTEYIEQLYKKYYKYMVHTACSYVKNQTEAEDIVHQSVFKLYDNMKKIRELGEGRELTCITYIVKSQAIDYLRKSKTHQYKEVLTEEYGEYGENDIEEGAEAQYFARGEIKYEELYKKVRLLKSRDRDLLVYKYFMEYSEREIGKVMNIPERNVGKYISRAKERLLRLIRGN